MKRTIGLALATVLVVSAGVASADATIQSVSVFEAMGGPPTDFAVGKEVRGVSATVYRNDDGVGIVIETKKLSAGTFTAWVFECTNGTLVPCTPIMGPPSFCSGDTAGPNAKVELVCGLADDGLARAPFVVLILDHGPIDPELIHLQLSIPPGGVPAQTVKVDAVD